jgi:hypothetical protein
LFAGTERETYVSFDDGDHWQSLRLNMPATSIRDLVIKDDDLVVGTHGRGFWILDNITPLRQLNQTSVSAEAVLFRPQTAYRVRWNMNTDTPLPPEEPAGQNPPDGAIIDYALKSAASGPVTLEILDSTGNLVRRYSSTDPVEPLDPYLSIPTYWVRPPQVLSGDPGMYRFLWDMHYPPAQGIEVRYPIAAIYGNTAPRPTSPWVMPGPYTVKLTVNGQTYSHPLTVKMDPRVKTPLTGLAEQFYLSKEMYDGIVWIQTGLQQIRSIRAQVAKLQESAGEGGLSQDLSAFDKKASTLEGKPVPRFRRSAPSGPVTLNSLNASLTSLMGLLQSADVTPSTQVVAAIAARRGELANLKASWDELKTQDVTKLNAQIERANLPVIVLNP